MRVMPEQRGGLFGGLGRLVKVLLLMAVILAVAGWFGVRTRGAVGLLENWLARRTGLAVSIGTARIAWPYDLALESVSTPDFAQASSPGGAAGRVRIGWRPRGWLVRLEALEVRIRNDEQGLWTPAFLAPLGTLLDAPIGEISNVTESFRDRISLTVEDGGIVWMDARNEELTAVEGVRFRMQPLRAPRFGLVYYELSVERMRGEAAQALRDMRWIWLAYDHADYLELDARVRRVRPGRL